MGSATASAEAQPGEGGSETHRGNREMRWVSQGLNPSCGLGRDDVRFQGKTGGHGQTVTMNANDPCRMWKTSAIIRRLNGSTLTTRLRNDPQSTRDCPCLVDP